MPSEQEIENQQALLAAHRRTLSIYLNQVAIRGGEGYTSPDVINGIAEARANIQRIKQTLRGWGIRVVDDPNDVRAPYEPLPPYHPTSSPVPNDFDFNAFTRGGCLAKSLMIVGPSLIIAGFVLWMYIIFESISYFGNIAKIPPGAAPLELSPFPPLVTSLGPIALGVMILGGVIYWIGRLTSYTGISRKRSRRLGCIAIIIILFLFLVVIGSIGFLTSNKNSFRRQSNPLPEQLPTRGNSESVPVITSQGVVEVVSTGLSVRSGPSTDSSIIAYLAKGNTVPYFNVDPNTGWLQIRLPDGKTGWISGAPDYVLRR